MMLQNSRLKRAGWRRLMTACGFPANDAMHDLLIACYSEKHRFYHSLDHIDACFRHFDAVIETAIYPNEIELALWFHDVIYKPFSATNEEDSAELAKAFLLENKAAADMIDRVYDLIILTKDHAAPQMQDAKLMLDIDLSILGAAPHIYAQFEKDVRQEYKRVPSFIFKKKRKEILRTFIQRPQLYNSSYFYERLEAQAKRNLKWAIAEL
ncbi:MAG: hypothetical protein ABJN69_07895 [Hellea sp.]